MWVVRATPFCNRYLIERSEIQESDDRSLRAEEALRHGDKTKVDNMPLKERPKPSCQDSSKYRADKGRRGCAGLPVEIGVSERIFVRVMCETWGRCQIDSSRVKGGPFL